MHSTKQKFKGEQKKEERNKKNKKQRKLRKYFVYLPDDILDEWFQHLRRNIIVRFTRANHFSNDIIFYKTDKKLT